MTDPVSLVALAAAVGGLAGKFGEKAWDLAEKWLARHFENHVPAAQAAARANSASFVYELATRVGALEETHAEIKQRVAEAQSDPHFSLVLQKAILGSAQTDDRRMHALLADLVAARLLADSESTLSLAIGLACGVVPNLTSDQLRLLALLVFLHEIRPRDRYAVKQDYHDWLAVHLRYFDDLEYREIDVRHLVALGCVTFQPASERSLEVLFAMKNGLVTDEFLDFGTFFATGSGSTLEIAWNEGLAGVDLTSIGSVIGGKVHDSITGRSVGDPSWARPPA